MTGPGRRSNRRGQLVLLAAATLVVALVPMAVASLQLGFHEDVGAASVEDAPLRDAERYLDRAVGDAVDGIPSTYAWSNRTQAVTTVRNRLRDDLSTLNGSGVETGTVFAVSYNRSRATVWAAGSCTTGPGREFGSCHADRGLVVQDRASRTHVLAVAFDIQVTTADGHWNATAVVAVAR